MRFGGAERARIYIDPLTTLDPRRGMTCTSLESTQSLIDQPQSAVCFVRVIPPREAKVR